MRGDGSIFLRGGVYWMKFSVNGRPFSLSTGTANKTEAKNKLRDEVAKARGPQYVDPQQRKVTVGELMTDLFQWYRVNGRRGDDTADDMEQKWNSCMKDFFGNVRADQLTTIMLRTFRERRIKGGIQSPGQQRDVVTSATVNREFALIRRAYKIAMRATPPKVVAAPHFEMADESGNARKVFVTTEMEEKFIEAAARRGLWQRTWIESAFTYGWRVGEFARLLVKNVDLIDGRLRLDATKNGEPREVTLTPGLRVLYQALVAGKKPNERVFPRDFRKAWYELCESLGVGHTRTTGFTMHDIRRSSARNKRAAGVSESVIMNMQGWKTNAMFRAYAIVDQTDVLAALDAEARMKQRLADQRAQAPTPTTQAN